MHKIVVIPAYNEEATISAAVRSARKHSDEVIVVDDGSTDATAFKAGSAGARVLRHIINRGQGAALRTGIHSALSRGADCIVTFDADLQQDAKEIPMLVAPIAAGIADIALGSRTSGNAISIPMLRRSVLALATLFTRATTGLSVTDTHNGFRALSRRAALEIKITQDGFAHASEILSEIGRLKISYVEVPVTLSYSAYSLKKGQKITSAFKIIFDLIRSDLFK